MTSYQRDVETEAGKVCRQGCVETASARVQVGHDLEAGELCFLEKLWTDRVRVFKATLVKSDDQDGEHWNTSDPVRPARRVPWVRSPCLVCDPHSARERKSE